jgi:hypothetical protein
MKTDMPEEKGISAGETALFSNDKKTWIESVFLYQDLGYDFFATEHGRYKYAKKRGKTYVA